MEYYEKVEKLLNYAVYYTAQAMKYVIEEAKKKGGVNPDGYALTPYTELHPDEPVVLPQDVPKNERLVKGANKEQKKYLDISTIGNMMVIMAIGAPVFATVFIPFVIRYLKEENP